MAESRHPVGADLRLDGSPDRQVSFRIPLALDQRLDALVERAVEAGERTNRREVLSALLFAAQADGQQLGTILRTYRRASVGDAVLDVQPDDNVLAFARLAVSTRLGSTVTA